MKSYIQFLNENKGYYDEAVKLYKDMRDIKYDDNTRGYESFRDFAKLDEKKAEEQVARYKKSLAEKGYTIEDVSRIVNENKDLFLENPGDISYTIHEKTGQKAVEYGYAECGVFDIIMNQVTNGEFPLTGFGAHADASQAGVMDIEVKYNYGWHKNNKYSKMFMQKEYGSDEEAANIFIDNLEVSHTMQYDLGDMEMLQRGKGYAVFKGELDDGTEEYLESMPHIIYGVGNGKTYIIAQTKKYNNEELLRSIKGAVKFNLFESFDYNMPVKIETNFAFDDDLDDYEGNDDEEKLSNLFDELAEEIYKIDGYEFEVLSMGEDGQSGSWPYVKITFKSIDDALQALKWMWGSDEWMIYTGIANGLQEEGKEREAFDFLKEKGEPDYFADVDFSDEFINGLPEEDKNYLRSLKGVDKFDL